MGGHDGLMINEFLGIVGSRAVQDVAQLCMWMGSSRNAAAFAMESTGSCASVYGIKYKARLWTPREYLTPSSTPQQSTHLLLILSHISTVTFDDHG